MSSPGRLRSQREWVRAWKPLVGGVHEVFHARFVDYAYPPHLHHALVEPDDALEAEARLATVGERLRAHLGERPDDAWDRHPGRLASDLRDLLEVRLFDRTTLAEAGRTLGVSPSHLVRCFTGTFGIAPHQYVTARRIDAARKRLLDGEPIALVAAGVGFYDQAHFSRQFKRHVGTPPGRYALPT